MASGTEATQAANRAGMDPQRLVVGFLLAMAVVLTLFFSHIFTLIWTRWALPNTILISGPDWDIPTLLGGVVGIGLIVFAWLHKPTHEFALASATELMKVTWPSWGETRTSTMAVIVASLVAAVILFAIDSLAYRVMVDWLPALWGRL